MTLCDWLTIKCDFIFVATGLASLWCWSAVLVRWARTKTKLVVLQIVDDILSTILWPWLKTTRSSPKLDRAQRSVKVWIFAEVKFAEGISNLCTSPARVSQRRTLGLGRPTSRIESISLQVSKYRVLVLQDIRSQIVKHPWWCQVKSNQNRMVYQTTHSVCNLGPSNRSYPVVMNQFAMHVSLFSYMFWSQDYMICISKVTTCVCPCIIIGPEFFFHTFDEIILICWMRTQ